MSFLLRDIVNVKTANGTHWIGEIEKVEGFGSFQVRPFGSQNTIVASIGQMDLLEHGRPDPSEAIAEAWYEFREYAKAETDLVGKAYHLLRLSDRVGDLASFHPRYNERTGNINGVYEDEL